MTRRTLDGMALGGMYDLVGGGFHRYSVDERWLVPHFEKMLYDNALLASVYLHAARALRRRALPGDRRRDDRLRAARARARRRRLRLGAGRRHRRRRRADVHVGARRRRARGAAAAVRGRSLRPARRARRASCASGCFALREERPKPPRDDKAIASWNGLMLAALAQAGRLEPAVALGEFLLGPLSTPDGRLHRTWRDGVAKGTGYLEDYADVAYGLLELHVATGDPRWLREAHRLATLAVELFADRARRLLPDAGRRRATRRAQEGARRPSDAERQRDARLRAAAPRRASGATTSSSGAPCRCCGSCATRCRSRPSSFGWMLVALDQHLAPHRELAIVGAPDGRGRPRRRSPARERDRRRRLRSGRGRPAARRPVAGRRLPTVYRCERFACELPVTDPASV